MSIKEKYALTDEGVRNVKLGAAWTAAANIAVFAGHPFDFRTRCRLTLIDGRIVHRDGAAE